MIAILVPLLLLTAYLFPTISVVSRNSNFARKLSGAGRLSEDVAVNRICGCASLMVVLAAGSAAAQSFSDRAADNHPPPLLADVNGDGGDDLVAFGNEGAWVVLSRGDGSFGRPFLGIANFGAEAGNWRTDRHPRHLADVNGDGRADIVGFGELGVWVALGQQSGRFGPVFLAIDDYAYDAGNWRVGRHPRMVGDVNGDGRADIVGFGNDGAHVSLGQRNGRFSESQIHAMPFEQRRTNEPSTLFPD